MPPFLDRVQLDHALRNQALPFLEAVAANDNLRNRSLTRFERDDPPPYAESTESEELDDAPPPPLRGKLPEELESIMDEPIRSGELDCFRLATTLQPGDAYYTDARFEESRLSRYRGKFRGVEGAQRLGVLVRHNVKCGWEQLGVWNSEWGFPGRRLQPNDEVARWKWPWQQDETDDSDPKNAYTQQLLARALHLRQNLRRGESSPVIPRSHLRGHASVSEAESFIISRPWFIFQLEVAEEKARYLRLSDEHRQLYPYSPLMQVTKWWKERGDWREEFNRTEWVTSWKWRHESPSPEPEDLSPIESSPINSLDDKPVDITSMELTPSEIGDLEIIQLPRFKQPPDFWTIKDGYLGQRNFPGQTLDLTASAMDAIQKLKPPSIPDGFRLFWPDPSLSGERKHSPPELSRPQQDTVSPPPQDSQGSDQRIPQIKANKVQKKDNHPSPRRSARIANLKRSAEPLPSQTAPNKKPKRGATPKAAAPVTRHNTRETRSMQAGPVQARPSRKESQRSSIGKKTRLNKPSTVTKSPADTGQLKARPSRGRRRA